MAILDDIRIALTGAGYDVQVNNWTGSRHFLLSGNGVALGLPLSTPATAAALIRDLRDVIVARRQVLRAEIDARLVELADLDSLVATIRGVLP